MPSPAPCGPPGPSPRGAASSSTWTPSTPVRRKAAGSRIERSTWLSAAKLTMASAAAARGPTADGSAMSPWTKAKRDAISASASTSPRFARLPA